MNELTEIKKPTIDSREVAEMIGIQHKELLRKLEGGKDRKGYIEILTQHQMAPSDYFIESCYKDESGKLNKCYNFTKMGCEFIANKFTGEKGILFTAKYVKRFNDMESLIMPSMSKELQAIIMIDQKQQVIESKIEAVNSDLQDFKMDMPILGIECEKITTAARRKGVECLGGKKSRAYQDKSLRNRVYTDIYGQLKREFDITTYKAIKRSQSDFAVEIINSYKTPFALCEEIEECNNQICI